MNERSDINRVLETWMGEGPSTMPDRVIDVVADRISKRRQRPAWRLVWRRPMNSQLKLLMAAAAVLVVAVVTWQLLPGLGGPGDEPSATPTPTGTPLPLREGELTAGTYRLRPLDSAPNLSVDAIVPAGWSGNLPNSVEGPGGPDGPAGIFLIFMVADSGIFSDPCHWDVDGSGPFGQRGDIEVGPSVDELATALAARPTSQATTPTDVTIGGFPGKRVVLQVPSGDCDTLQGETDSVYFVFGGRDGGVYAKGDDNRWQVSIVDVGGTRLIAVLLSYGGTSAADLTAGQAILDSVVITP